VTVAQPGDPILLSFASCLQCKMCSDGHFSHCVKSVELNFVGNKAFTSLGSNQHDILGSFFGQSSFASLTVAKECSVVNVKGLIESDEDLRMFAPLGCGIQTGSGTILNVAQAKPTDSVAIMGAGGVGLAAVMGAKIAGCKIIIVIDRVQQRLNLAKNLGATHVINSTDMRLDDLVAEVRKLTDGYGTSITIDTTGVLSLIEKGIEFTARRGQYIQVGSTKPDVVLQIPVQAFMDSGKRIIGAIEGQVVPQKYIPQMIAWHRQGKFPFDKFMKQYPAEQFMEAIDGMHTGEIIKPIIVWQQ
jgi:Zn-dependent alcohol dehydrogenase